MIPKIQKKKLLQKICKKKLQITTKCTTKELQTNSIEKYFFYGNNTKQRKYKMHTARKKER